MKILVTVTFLLLLNYQTSYSTENIKINTKTADFFENFVSDTTLLLDQDLKNIISSDYKNVVNNSKFNIRANSWRPQPDPRIKLRAIYNNINNKNFEQSFSDLVEPLIEIACTPKQYDPMNKEKQICIENMLKYSIIDDIQISYNHDPGKTIEQYILDITNNNNNNRYQKIIITTAGIMNSAYSIVTNKMITKSMNIFKEHYPLLSVINNSNSSVNGNNSNTSAQKTKFTFANGPSADPIVIAKCKKSCEREYDICAMVGNQEAYTETQRRREGQKCARSLPLCNQGCEPFVIKLNQ